MTTTAAPEPAPYSRKLPAIMLAGMLVAIVLHDWNAFAANETYPAFLLFLSATGGLSLAGTIHPPFFYAAGKYGRDLPLWNKIVAGVAATAGFAAGMMLLFTRYGV